MSIDPTVFHGIYAATLTPFGTDGEIDEQLLRSHFRQVMAIDGIRGVLCNGHAGENFLLGTGTLCILGDYRGTPAIDVWNGPLV